MAADKFTLPLDHGIEGEITLDFSGTRVAELTVADHRGREVTAFLEDNEVRDFIQGLLDGLDTAGLRVENGRLIWPAEADCG